MTAQRDPRVSPQAGDVVRVGTMFRRVLRAGRGGVWWIDNDRWRGCSCGGAISSEQWVKDCSAAEVVHVAEVDDE